MFILIIALVVAITFSCIIPVRLFKMDDFFLSFPTPFSSRVLKPNISSPQKLSAKNIASSGKSIGKGKPQKHVILSRKPKDIWKKRKGIVSPPCLIDYVYVVYQFIPDEHGTRRKNNNFLETNIVPDLSLYLPLPAFQILQDKNQQEKFLKPIVKRLDKNRLNYEEAEEELLAEDTHEAEATRQSENRDNTHHEERGEEVLSINTNEVNLLLSLNRLAAQMISKNLRLLPSYQPKNLRFYIDHSSSTGISGCFPQILTISDNSLPLVYGSRLIPKKTHNIYTRLGFRQQKINSFARITHNISVYAPRFKLIDCNNQICNGDTPTSPRVSTMIVSPLIQGDRGTALGISHYSDPINPENCLEVASGLQSFLELFRNIINIRPGLTNNRGRIFESIICFPPDSMQIQSSIKFPHTGKLFVNLPPMISVSLKWGEASFKILIDAKSPFFRLLSAFLQDKGYISFHYSRSQMRYNCQLLSIPLLTHTGSLEIRLCPFDYLMTNREVSDGLYLSSPVLSRQHDDQITTLPAYQTGPSYQLISGDRLNSIQYTASDKLSPLDPTVHYQPYQKLIETHDPQAFRNYYPPIDLLETSLNIADFLAANSNEGLSLSRQNLTSQHDDQSTIMSPHQTEAEHLAISKVPQKSLRYSGFTNPQDTVFLEVASPLQRVLKEPIRGYMISNQPASSDCLTATHFQGYHQLIDTNDAPTSSSNHCHRMAPFSISMRSSNKIGGAPSKKDYVENFFNSNSAYYIDKTDFLLLQNVPCSMFREENRSMPPSLKKTVAHSIPHFGGGDDLINYVYYVPVQKCHREGNIHEIESTPTLAQNNRAKKSTYLDQPIISSIEEGWKASFLEFSKNKYFVKTGDYKTTKNYLKELENMDSNIMKFAGAINKKYNDTIIEMEEIEHIQRVSEKVNYYAINSSRNVSNKVDDVIIEMNKMGAIKRNRGWEVEE